MAGFGRTGEWFAIDHWKVVPDIITMAKGLTAAYVQLGAVGMRRELADKFNDKVFYGGLTYNSHPLACAAALATIKVYEDDKLLENARRMGAVMKQLMTDLAAKHPSVGAARSIGLFGLVELVRDKAKREPMAPFNGTSDEMAALGKFFRQEGLYTFVRLEHVLHEPAAVHHRRAAARRVRDRRSRARDHGPRRGRLASREGRHVRKKPRRRQRPRKWSFQRRPPRSQRPLRFLLRRGTVAAIRFP